jgi:hypothetical protein
MDVVIATARLMRINNQRGALYITSDVDPANYMTDDDRTWFPAARVHEIQEHLTFPGVRIMVGPSSTDAGEPIIEAQAEI